jgi:hypothetical protein
MTLATVALVISAANGAAELVLAAFQLGDRLRRERRDEDADAPTRPPSCA